MLIHPSRIFLYACLSFIAGIAVSSAVFVPELLPFVLAVIGIGFIVIFYRTKARPGPAFVRADGGKIFVSRLVIIGVCLVMIGLGTLRHQMFDVPADSQDYYKKNYSQAYLEDGSNFFTSRLYALRENLGKSVDSSLSPPESSLLGAMMLGETERLSWELKEDLSRSGTRHITAISGMHIVILSGMLMSIGILFGLKRKYAFYFVVGIIILYIIMVGSPPSAIRAGIMGGILFFAQSVGRVSQSQRLLVLAATLMLAMNPLLMRFDIGFQLSFFATLGIATLSPWIREKLASAPSFLDAKNTLAMTIPAVIFTAPILALNFGEFSVVSIFTNILIVPLVSLVLGLGLLASIAGVIFHSLGEVLFWPVWLVLSYVHKVIEVSARLSFSVIETENFAWYMNILYFALLFWVIKYFKLAR